MTVRRATAPWWPGGIPTGVLKERVYGAEALEPQSIKDFTVDFVRRIAEGRKPAVGYEDGLKALELAIAAREAAATEGPRFLSAKDAKV